MSLHNARANRGTRRGDVLRPGLSRTRLAGMAVAAAVVTLVAAAPALAATGGGEPMPWEGPMEQMLAFFTGPFVRIAAVIAIVLLGIGMAFSENGTGMRKLTTAFFGLSLAFGAVTWGLSFFGFSGGATIVVPAGTFEVMEVVERAPDHQGGETPAATVRGDAAVSPGAEGGAQ